MEDYTNSSSNGVGSGTGTGTGSGFGQTTPPPVPLTPTPVPPHHEPPATRRTKKYISGYVKAILVIFIFAAGIYLGAVTNIGNIQEKIVDQVNGQQLIGLERFAQGFSEEVDAQLFWEVWDLVQEKYAKGPQDELNLFYGAIEGAVASLEDPYSVFLKPEITKQFVADLSGTFEGIGAEIGKRQGRLLIVAPLPDSPAEKAGLESGDIVVTIDGEDAGPLPLDEAVRRIRGPRGTDVEFEVFRESTDELLDISVTRAPIDIPTVDYERRDDGVVYARISHYNNVTLQKFEPVIHEAVKSETKGLIIDLRNNPGGFLDVAVAMTSEWLEDDQVVVKEDFYNGEGRDQEYKSNGKHRLAGVPTVVLINGGSASGSEIMAGALQDYEVAQLIGTTTFGKGSVQDFQTFSDGSALKLTVAEWLLPNGRNINEKGIDPDILIETEEDILAMELGEVEDAILAKALEILLGTEGGQE